MNAVNAGLVAFYHPPSRKPPRPFLCGRVGRLVLTNRYDFVGAFGQGAYVQLHCDDDGRLTEFQGHYFPRDLHQFPWGFPIQPIPPPL